jgi:hypothetical protein
MAVRYRARNVHEVAAEIFADLQTAQRYLTYLHNVGEIRIVGWPPLREGNPRPVAAYRLGAGEDVPRPPPKTPIERAATYRAKIRSDMDRYDSQLARDRARKFKVRRDPLVEAMFGAAPVQGGRHA